MTNEFHVPKRRVPLEVVLVGGRVCEVAVFLAELASSHDGRERVSDLLNGPRTFLPALDRVADRTTFLNYAAIAFVRVAATDERSTAEELTIPTEHEVTVTLIDGQKLQGLLSYVLPPDRSRVLDHLNEAPPFLRLLGEGLVAFVNVQQIAQVDLITP